MKPVRDLLNIEEAKRVAIEYCKKRHLSLDKLNAQKVIDLGTSVIFGQPRLFVDLQLFGLEHDIDTQPCPTLILRKTAEGYEVEETPDTFRYLKP